MALTLISGPDLLATGMNEMAVKLHSDVADAVLYLQLQPQWSDGGTVGVAPFITLGPLDVDADGDATFFIGDYLMDVFGRTVDTLPAASSATPVRLENALREYAWLAVEYTPGTEAATDTLSNVSERYVLRGGISRMRHRVKPFFASTLASNWHVDLGRTWLDAQHTTKGIQINQPDWVGITNPWVLNAATYNAYLHVVCTWADGTETTHDDLADTVDVDPYTVWAWPCGPDQLGLAALNTGVALVRYTVRVGVTGGGLIPYASGERAYVIDHNAYRHTTDVMYLNGLGTWTCLRMKGAPVHDTTVDKEQHSRYWENGNALSDGEESTLVQQVAEGVTVSTGYARDRTEAALFKEMCASQYVRVLMSDDTEAEPWWAPVVVLTAKSTIDMDSNLNRLVLTYRHAWDDRVPDMLMHR